MKRMLFTLFLAMLAGFSQAQQPASRFICRIGFTYEISSSDNWGKDQPVVLSVVPYSSAELAGIRTNDIIDRIDGIPTVASSPEEISKMLNPAGKSQISLLIKNLANAEREVIIKKDCKRTGTLTEENLALAYSLYSPETTGERTFTCPFRYTVQPGIDFSGFKTYAFTIPDPGNEALEKTVNECISKELNQKGLQFTTDNPDLLVQTFYFFDVNPDYQENKLVIRSDPEYRFHPYTRKMEKFPFLPVSSNKINAKYLLQLGIRLIDRRNPDIDKLQVIWECEANELLTAPYKLEEYAQTFVPLMCMQYPYVKKPQNVSFRLTYNTYNYTGIGFDIDRLEHVISVDRNSPAYEAGIRNNDVITGINGHTLNHTAEAFTEAYRAFVAATMPYRDASTRFTDADGFRYAMMWNREQYPRIADELKKEEYLPAFSYLYYFAPYVNPSGTNSCNFIVKRGSHTQEINVRPVIRTSVILQIR